MALTWKFRGFDYSSYYNGAYENADSLPSLEATGANAIETTLDWGIDPLTNTVYADSSYTDPLTAEAAVIRQAVAAGLQVMVKPHIDFLNSADLKGTPYSVGDWRTYYNPGAAGSAGANAFFASYKTMILQEAAVAAANGATMLSIGTELDQICGPAYKSYWDGIISAIRAQDPSLKLTYAADWNDALSPWQYGGSGLPVGTGNLATQISFASELDYLGLDVYAPLANTTTPTLQQLVNGWTQTPVNSGATAETYAVTGNQSLIKYFESLSTAVGKPLLFTEVGFENATDAAESPANSSTNVEDAPLQSLAYQSLFDAFSQSGDTSVAGAFIYNWDPNASEVGTSSIAFSPQNLPALSAVDAAFAAPTFTAVPATFEAGLNIAVSVPNLSVSTGSTGSIFTVTVIAVEGTFSATGPATITGSGTSDIVLTGSLANVDTSLSTLTYTGTKAANDTITATARADGGPSGSVTFLVNYDANFPVLTFNLDTFVSGTTVNLSGTVNTANAGRTVTYLVNSASAGTAVVQTDGSFATNVVMQSGIVNIVRVELTDAAGGTGVSSPLMVAVSDGLTANFSAANGDVVNLFNATATGDTVNGSNGTIVLLKAKASIYGGGDTVYTDNSASDSAIIYNTAGVADSVYGANGSVTLHSSQADVIGANDTVYLDGSASNVATVTDNDAAWDNVYGGGGETIVSDAFANINGANNLVDLVGATGNFINLIGSANTWDNVYGGNGQIDVTKAFVNISGVSNIVYLQGTSGNFINLINSNNTWDNVYGGYGQIDVTKSFVNIYGAANNVYFQGTSGNIVNLINSNNTWENVYGGYGQIDVTQAFVNVNGASNSVFFQGASGNFVNMINSANTWEQVHGGNGYIDVTNAFVNVFDQNNTVLLQGASGNFVNLIGASTTADTVDGSNGQIDVTNSTASINGGADTAYLLGTSDTLTINGANDTVAMQKGVGGVYHVNGFAANDILQFSKSDFASYQALSTSGDLVTNGNTTVVTIGANSVTVSGAALTSANFAFV